MSGTMERVIGGQDGRSMPQVWIPQNNRFDDGIAEIVVPEGFKPPEHGPNFNELLEKHRDDFRESVCADCKIRITKGRTRCRQCYEKYRSKRRRDLPKENSIVNQHSMLILD